MISQADIIRTLVNKNCTDESILTTALSPDCTPPKLLEKFTEAERFDLALDVSMKLGWDVLPLWKTWAMRCLKNGNFRGAREKFRHCFQRIRSPVARAGLLCDILKVLTRMEENKLTLSEEIELIKHRQRKSCNDNKTVDSADQHKPHLKISETKPKILEECLNYLREFGSNEQRIDFYVSNQLWDEAIKMLLDHRDQIDLNKFFITNVISYSATTGHLDKIVAAFIKHDREFDKSLNYFETIYKYYTTHNRYNTLCYVQSEIGDHVAAAEIQVINFFLKKPTLNYKELNQRLSSLISARDNYNQYLAKLNDQSTIQEQVGQVGAERVHPKLFTQPTKSEAEARLLTINTQIDITRNFAINEVTGCINGIEVVVSDGATKPNGTKNVNEDDTSPVTLFEQSEKRRTLLIALIMIYFDLNCDAYFSDSGFDLANRLMIEFDLDKLQVFKTAMRVILDDESSDIVKNTKLLLKRLQEDYLACTKRTKIKSATKASQASQDSSSSVVIAQPLEITGGRRTERRLSKSSTKSSVRLSTSQTSKGRYSFNLVDKNIQPGTIQAASLLCDEIIRDAIRICHEPDYKMELSKLLSAEARIELNIELGKLSIAQRLAFDMNRPDYVAMILKEADRLNQDHVKDVCQHWLAKH